MIVSDTKKFVFIHVPKAGGMSIRSVLQKYATVGVWKHPQYPGIQKNERLWKHAPAKDVRKYVKQWDQYFKFAFVRNPWSWIVSVYYYIRKDRTDPRYSSVNKLNFKDFLEWFCSWDSEQYPIRNGQLSYLVDNDGCKIVDFIGKVEHIDRDFDKVCNRIQVGCKLEKLNTTDHKPYRQYYSNKTQVIVDKLFREDIEAFGYSF